MAIEDVTAVDIDPEVLARAAYEYTGITWICGDVMNVTFDRTFDVVASVATLHHLTDLPATIKRLADLTSPGGVMVVVGLARATSFGDHLMGLVGAVQHKWYSRTRGVWEHSAPTVWPPPHSYREVAIVPVRCFPESDGGSSGCGGTRCSGTSPPEFDVTARMRTGFRTRDVGDMVAICRS